MLTVRPVRGCVLLLILVAATSWSQLNTGSIAGAVKDPSGAVVPNAQVTLTDAAKGFTYTAVTDSNGFFTIRSLPAATYTERVEAPGFSPYERPNIVLNVGSALNADVSLSVATAGQTVTVNEAGGSLLQTEDAVTGQTLDRTFINNLPLIGRQVFDLAFLAPGVAPATGQAYGAGSSAGNNFVSNGSRNAQADILIDGVSTTNYEQNSGFVVPLFTPSVDAVQEFRVEQSNFSAQYGFTGGTVINVVTRSGTNQFHGSAYEFWRNDILNANSFFNNISGTPRQKYRWNDFGATFGGPIKKDRIFFFGDYEGQRQITSGTRFSGVPSPAERAGNFGELCTRAGGTFNAGGTCSVQSGQLYDPYANLVQYQGGTFRTTPIPFNNLATYASPANGSPATLTYAYQTQTLSGTGTALPSTMGIVPNRPGNLINPVAQRIVNNYLPLPTAAPGSSGYNPYNNFYGAASQYSYPNQFDIKVDARATDRDQFSIHEGTSYTNALSGANVLGNVFESNSAGVITGITMTSSVNYTHIFSPTTVLTASGGYTHQFQNRGGLPTSYPNFSPVTSLGLPSYMLASGTVAAPLVQLGPYGQYGGQGWSVILNGNDVYQMIASVAHTAGSHDLHFGGEFRLHRINYYQPGIPGGVFNFGQGGTSQTGSVGGDALASFLVGFPTGWSAYGIANQPATQSLQYAGFIQDNWHVSSRLTLNLGLRYDVDMPRTERYNRMTYFDPNVPNPLAQTGLLPTNSPCAACNQGNLMGSFEFTGLNGNPRTPYNTYYGAIGPRFGLAYRIGDKTTVRTGYGIYYDPSKAGAAGAGSGQGGFLGYIQQVNFQAYQSSDNSTPNANLSNPFPGGIAPPSGTYQYQLAGMPGGDAGSGPIRTWNVLPSEQSWSFGIQRELPGSVLVEANYVGRKGTHLYFGGDTYSINHIPAWVQTAYVNGQASTFNGNVPFPLAAAGQALTRALGGGAFSNAFYNPTWQMYNQYLPYPQYPLGLWGSSGLQAIDPPWANSIYNALQVRVEKRFSHGLQALLTYTHSKSLDNASTTGSNEYLSGGPLTGGGVPSTVQDPNNLRLERSYSNFDIPDIFQVSWVYQFPVGKGKRYGANWNRLVEGVLGGWQLNGSFRWDNGTPLILGLNGGTSAPNYNQRPNYPAA
ncbi:MAG: TonB-dependent receptor, partial [Acidobacteriaceae bacterium]|nr:TonB-dependent receptor [Acidobacteriaceae bacterium]